MPQTTFPWNRHLKFTPLTHTFLRISAISICCQNVEPTTTSAARLDSAVPLLLVQPLAWGILERLPATGYLLGQVTMPWDEKNNPSDSPNNLVQALLQKWNYDDWLWSPWTCVYYLWSQCCRLSEAETVGRWVHAALRHLTAGSHRRHTAGHPSGTHWIKHFCEHTLKTCLTNSFTSTW